MMPCREAEASLRQDVEKHVQGKTLAAIVDPCSGSWLPQQAHQFASLAIR